MDIQIVKPSASASSTQPVILNVAGPYWVACQLTTLLSLHKGIKYVLLNGFTVEGFLNTVQKFKVNSVVIAPDQVVALVKRGDFSQYDTSSLVSITVGGAPTPVAMFNALQAKLGTCMVAQVFGMTECMAVVEPAFGVTDRVGNVGKLVANADAKVVDLETGKLLGRNCPGEVWLRTTSLMKGYRNNPEATAAAIDKDGFLHTGDVGYFDEEGYLFIVDRIKELIKYKRDHVPPIEIEEVLLSHPDVKEAAVVGVFHEEDWEHATGVVVLKPGASATAGELLGLVEASLPQFKWLHGGIRFMDALPRTASGKINKKAIRDSLAQSK